MIMPLMVHTLDSANKLYRPTILRPTWAVFIKILNLSNIPLHNFLSIIT